MPHFPTRPGLRLAVEMQSRARLGGARAGVDLLRSKDGPKVLEVNSSPGLEGIEAVSGKDIAGMIIDHAAENVRSLVHVPDDDDIAPAG